MISLIIAWGFYLLAAAVVIFIVLYTLYGIYSVFALLGTAFAITEDAITAKQRAKASEEERARIWAEADAQNAKDAEVGSLLALRFLSQELLANADATIETAHRSLHGLRTTKEYESLAQRVGLQEFISYDPYLVEINSDEDDGGSFYRSKLYRMYEHIDSLLRSHGSQTRLRDLPEVVEALRPTFPLHFAVADALGGRVELDGKESRPRIVVVDATGGPANSLSIVEVNDETGDLQLYNERTGYYGLAFWPGDPDAMETAIETARDLL